MTWRNYWAGNEAFCLASGPSLTQADVDRVMAWRAAAAGRRVIVCNTTFRVALEADALFAHDRKWWDVYGPEVVETFKGRRFAACSPMPRWRHERLVRSEFKAFGNSGTGSIALAVYAGCRRVYLLGVDCKRGPGGEIHHHGDHPKPLSNARSMPKWPSQFQNVANHAAQHGVEVFNCSRDSALTCFTRMTLEDAIG